MEHPAQNRSINHITMAAGMWTLIFFSPCYYFVPFRCEGVNMFSYMNQIKQKRPDLDMQWEMSLDVWR